jgi:HD superfamily phosphodiesterase
VALEYGIRPVWLLAQGLRTGKDQVEGPPKTLASRRPIPMSAELASALERWRKQTYTAGRMGSALYDARGPRGESRPLDDLRFALDHFPKKLLTLVEGFHTAEGQRLAETRQRALQAFYDGMLAEVSL